MTPLEFAADLRHDSVDEYVCLVNDPRETSPYGTTFTVEHLGNVVGAPPVIYLNVEVDVMKRLAIDVDRRRRAGLVRLRHRPDVATRKLGLWDAGLYDRGGGLRHRALARPRPSGWSTTSR